MDLDLTALRAVSDACAASDGNDPVDEYGWMTLRNHPEKVTGQVEEHGFALTYEGQVAVAVAPEARSAGLGGRLLGTLLAGIGEDEPLEAWSHGQHPAAAALATRFGFAPVRDLWVMRRSLGTDAPLPQPSVQGWTMRSYRASDAEDLLRINAAAFAHHPEQGAMDAANLADRMAEDWYDPRDLLVAEDRESGQMLGFHWTKRHSSTEGEVYVVGVAPEAQGRGLGKALTLAGLAHLAETGIRAVHLYVESDNAPAVAVYSRLGFAHAPEDTHLLYRRG